MLDTIRVWAEAHTPNALRIVFILLLAWVIRGVLGSIVTRIERLHEAGDPETRFEREKRAQTIGRILQQASAVLIWSVGTMLVLAELGIDLKPILAAGPASSGSRSASGLKRW